ncbi:MAG: FliA/WhiG family RNA polymerase sigma factor [Proteobacteria bacterium]|nr:FliA/WhiG family RNA polymerase sigma factor [Pseudomonadota bacterium]MCP4915468.1 FliA/WhiG family RNA polymerase sigma factor [Pseudomonadota bacterium]
MTATAQNTQDRREALILAHYPMVRSVAYRMVGRFPSCVEAEDLITIGTIGLIDAVDKFQENQSVTFSAYARIRVGGAILDELRKEDWVPRSVRTRHHELKTARETLRMDLGRDPTQQEWAKALGVTTARLNKMVQDSTLKTLISMEETTPSGDESIGDSLVGNSPNPMDEATRGHVAAMVREAICTLPERERYLVEMYYFQDLTFKEIGAILDVTESRVSQLHTRMKSRLYSKLQSVIEQD